MKDSGNLHKKLQELCDCYSTTDPLKEMSELSHNQENLEAALKWIAVSVLHGVNSNAKKITIKQTDNGTISVTAEYRDTQLPPPDGDIATHIFETIKAITHIESDKGKSRLALGIRDSSLDLDISVKDKSDYKKASIKFP